MQPLIHNHYPIFLKNIVIIIIIIIISITTSILTFIKRYYQSHQGKSSESAQMFRSRFLSVLKVDSLKKTCRMPKITKKMWRAFKHFFGWESYEETLQNFEMSFFATSNNTPMDFCWRRGYRKRWFCKRMFERIPEWLVTPPTNMAPFCWYPCVNYWLNSQILVWGYNFGVSTQFLWSGLRSLR